MAPGILPLVLLLIPHVHPMTWYLRLPILLVTVGMSAFAVRHARLFLRNGEDHWMTSVVSYAAITLMLLMAFPGQVELGMTVTIIIAFGDGSATLAGLLVRGRRLPWNNAKSWAGLSAFLLCAIPLATLVYWGESRPHVALPIALACAVPTAIVAALVESLPTRINDNLRVGITSGLTILLMHSLFVGW